MVSLLYAPPWLEGCAEISLEVRAGVVKDNRTASPVLGRMRDCHMRSEQA